MGNMSMKEGDESEIKKESELKKIMKTIATAAIERIGKESPIQEIARDTFLLKFISDITKSIVNEIIVIGGFEIGRASCRERV